MATALRPLDTGELLDRTFSLYRTHFSLFVGIVALPNLASLAVQLVAAVERAAPGAAISEALGNLFWVFAAAATSLSRRAVRWLIPS